MRGNDSFKVVKVFHAKASNTNCKNYAICLLPILLLLASCGNTISGSNSSELNSSTMENDSADSTDTIEASVDYDFILPEDISIKYFGMNIYSKDYNGWNNHIFGSQGYVAMDSFGENSYVMNVDKAGGYYPTEHVIKEYNSVNGTTGRKVATIDFDNEGLIKEINIVGKNIDDFYITGPQVGDNVKDYINLLADGLWDKLMAMESNKVLRGANGWYMYHNDQVVCLNNELITISYRLHNETVDNIHVFTMSDLIKTLLKEELYDIDEPYFYIDGINLVTSEMQTWVDFYDFKYYEGFGYIPYADDELFVRFRLDDYGFNLTFANSANVEWVEYKTQSGNTINYPELLTDDTNTYCTIDGFISDYSHDMSIEIYPLIKDFSRFEADKITFGDDFASFINSYDQTAYDRVCSEDFIRTGFWEISKYEYDGITYGVMYKDYKGPTHSEMFGYSFTLDGTKVTGIHVTANTK